MLSRVTTHVIQVYGGMKVTLTYIPYLHIQYTRLYIKATQNKPSCEIFSIHAMYSREFINRIISYYYTYRSYRLTSNRNAGSQQEPGVRLDYCKLVVKKIIFLNLPQLQTKPPHITNLQTTGILLQVCIQILHWWHNQLSFTYQTDRPQRFMVIN